MVIHSRFYTRMIDDSPMVDILLKRQLLQRQQLIINLLMKKNMSF